MKNYKIARSIFFLGLLSTFTFAKTIVVPQDYPSIQKALDEAENGDTILVRKGLYRESLIMNDGTVLKGEDTDKTIIRGNRRDPVIRVANKCTVTNLTVERGGVGILSENTNAVIEHCLIRQNDKSGIQCLISLPNIRNNIIASNNWSGIFCELISYGMRTSIEHNVIAQNGYCGIMLSNKSVVLVQNNILYNNKQYGIYVTENAKKSRITYNSIYNNRKPYNTYAIVNETNIAKDPKFTNIAALSYSELSQHRSVLKGLGKDGATIGITLNTNLKKTDTDKDGVFDEKDQCPNDAEDFDGFEDEDGCPDFDNDFDGMYDKFDQCPNKAEDFDGYEDTDGCPDLDNDKDGIPDSIDQCPNNPETINQYKDEDGCPDDNPNKN